MNDYERIARVLRYVDENHTDQPDLATLARHVGLSQHHFHRLFTSWAGITPKDFLQCLTLAHAKEMLRQGKSVLDAALDTGLSSPSRLHDLCINLEAASPGEVKSGGKGGQSPSASLTARLANVWLVRVIGVSATFHLWNLAINLPHWQRSNLNGRARNCREMTSLRANWSIAFSIQQLLKIHKFHCAPSSEALRFKCGCGGHCCKFSVAH